MDGTKAEGGEYFELDWDDNGNMVEVDMSTGDDTTLEYNCDDKLWSVTKGSTSIDLKYDPDGNRIFKDSSETGQRKYIVDIVGGLPVILMELNNSGGIVKTYIYANSQIIAQHTGDHEADRYFYLHDRLGSVRQIIDTSGNVKNRYTYDPFGEEFDTECTETIENPFKFTGQFYDSEIDQYYLRARQYDPHIARFTARDPIFGQFEEPQTLHAYLYCGNDPLNHVDPSGLWKHGIRYNLGKMGIENAYTLSDQELETRLSGLSQLFWHGHSDFGYILGDFDYTRLDRQWWTHPVNVPFAFIGFGTTLHFRRLEGVGGAEYYLGFTLRSGNWGAFEQYMHMGQDYFSHVGRGHGPLLGPVTHLIDDFILDNPPDFPYTDETKDKLHFDFLAAQKWTKQMEELWYLFWDMNKWLGLP